MAVMLCLSENAGLHNLKKKKKEEDRSAVRLKTSFKFIIIEEATRV